MKLNEITIKKTLGYRNTVKKQDGSYESRTNEAEVAMTFTGDINEDEATEQVKKRVLEVLEAKGEPAWMTDETKETRMVKGGE